jgi:hypothetical protein
LRDLHLVRHPSLVANPWIITRPLPNTFLSSHMDVCPLAWQICNILICCVWRPQQNFTTLICRFAANGQLSSQLNSVAGIPQKQTVRQSRRGRREVHFAGSNQGF